MKPHGKIVLLNLRHEALCFQLCFINSHLIPPVGSPLSGLVPDAAVRNLTCRRLRLVLLAFEAGKLRKIPCTVKNKLFGVKFSIADCGLNYYAVR